MLMKKTMIATAAVAAASFAALPAAEAKPRVHIDVHIGGPAAFYPAPYYPAPGYYAGPVYSPRPSCVSRGSIYAGLRDRGFHHFRNGKWHRRYVYLTAKRGGGWYRIKLRRCSGSVMRIRHI